MQKYNFFKTDGRMPSREQMLDTQLFYKNASEIYARFDEWKDSDRFYFIPLYLQMTYNCGWVAEMAPDPVWLGSFVKTTLDHPDLFQYQCPHCGKPVLPYRYTGSPLSSRVDLKGRCPCGWKGFESVTGWRIRATALRDQIASDKARYRKYVFIHPKACSSSVADLMHYLNR